jgi:hypothetical protein
MDNTASEDNALSIVASSGTPMSKGVCVRADCRYSVEVCESQYGKHVKRVDQHDVEY